MSLDMLPFTPSNSQENTVFNVEQIPKELEVYWSSETSFLPDGKTFDDLTSEEKAKLRSQYRFSPYRPGLYQTITGYGKMV